MVKHQSKAGVYRFSYRCYYIFPKVTILVTASVPVTVTARVVHQLQL